MKFGLKKLLVSVCCIAMLLSAFAVVGSARELSGKYNTESAYFPSIRNYTWEALTDVVSTQQTAKYFVITVKAGEHTEQLFVSFPKTGGFRLESLHEWQKNNGLTTPAVSHAGLFEPDAVNIEYKKDGSGAIIMTGTDGTVVRYVQNGKAFQLQICEKTGKQIIYIGSGQISFAYANNSDIVVRTMVEMPLVDKEGIYLGSAASRDTNQVGDTLSLTVTDSWNDPDYLYIANPLYHSNRGYSMWFNMPYMGKQDCGEDNPEKMTITFDSTTDIKLDVFFWAGTPLENLKKYTDITGRSGVSPTYSFGYWTGSTAVAYLNQPQGFDPKRSSVPHENIVTMLEEYYDNYGFYPEVIGLEANNESAITQNYIKQRGMVGLFWYHPSADMNTTAALYLPAESKYPTFDANGNMTAPGWPYPWNTWLLNNLGIYQFADNWNYLDYSNPSAVRLVKAQIANKVKMGNRGAMIDYGEWAHTDGVYYNGLQATGEMHQLMSYYYGKTLNEVHTDLFGNDYILYQRSGWSGSQQFAGNFLGDQASTLDGYMDHVHMMIGLGAGGYNLYGGDLGGFVGKPSNEMWNRWVPLGVFSPYFRKHGQSLKMPVSDFDSLAAKSFGSYYYFRKNIVPTIEGAAIDANKTSNPIVKGMMMAYPYQLPLADVHNQYLFCDDFLVCAVTLNEVSYQQTALPKGSTWYDLYSYRAYAGGQIIQAEAPAATMPVFVKGGAVKAINLPESMKLGAEMHDNSGDEYQAIPSLLITPPDAERKTVIHVKDGESVDYQTYESHTETYVSTPKDKSVFTVTNSDGSDREIMLALGVTAAAVTVDGEPLHYLDHTPDYWEYEYGFTVDRQGMTTIYMPAGWKEVTITKGDAKYVPLKLVPKSQGSMKTMLDDDPSSIYMLPRGNTSIEVALEAPAEVGRVVVKWAPGFYDEYDIEYSENGEDWLLLPALTQDEHTVVGGCGSVDVIDCEAVKVAYLRIVPAKEGDTSSSPAIYEFLAYGPDEFKALDVLVPEDEEIGEEEDDWTDEEWEDWEDEDGKDKDKTTSKKQQKKVRLVHYFPWWIILLIALGGLAIVSGLLLLILLLAKKKKKKAQEAAQAAEEDTTES